MNSSTCEATVSSYLAYLGTNDWKQGKTANLALSKDMDGCPVIMHVHSLTWLSGMLNGMEPSLILSRTPVLIRLRQNVCREKGQLTCLFWAKWLLILY